MDATASLKISVDSTDAATAEQDLNSLAGAANRTETAARRASRSWIDAIQRIATETTGLGTRFDALNSTQSKMLAVLERVSTQMDSLQQAVGQVGTRLADTAATAGKATQAMSAAETATAAVERETRKLAETEAQAMTRIRAMVAASVERTAAMDAQTRASLAAASAAAALARQESAAGAAASQAAATRRATVAAQTRSFQAVADEIGEVNRALNSIGQGAGSLEGIQANTAKLLALWDKGQISADQYAAAVKRLDADEQRLVTSQAKAAAEADRFIAKLKEEATTANMTRKQLLEYQAAKLGVATQAGPYISRLTEADGATKKFQASTAQTAYAIRMLPSQFSDAASQLATGTNPFMVLFQQGSQVRDQFGGLGAMMSGLATLITPVSVAVTLVTAAVVSLGAAYIKGAAEARAFNEALALTGNAVGLTTAQLAGMAQEVSRVSGGGKVGAAAEALAKLAATAKFTADEMPLIAQAAVAMQSAVGRPIDETVAQFVRLSEQPTKAAEELNRQTGFLTVGLYEKIRALEESGRKGEAAALAERTHAQATIDAADRVKENLGTLERSWRSVRDTAKGAWDAMKNVGREGSDDDLRAQLAQNQQLQAALEARGRAGRADNGLGRLIQRVMGTPPQESSYQVRIRQLQEELNRRGVAADNADSEGVSRRASQRAVDATGTIMGMLRTSKDPAAKSADLENLRSMALDIWSNAQINPTESGSLAKRLQYDPESGKFSGELWDTLLRNMEARYQDSSGAAQANRAVQAQVAAIQASTRIEVNTLRESVAEQKQLRDVGATNLTEYYDNVYTLQASSLERQLGLAQQEVVANQGDAQIAARTAAQGRVEEIQRQIEANEKDHVNNLRSIRLNVEKDIAQMEAGWERQGDAAQAAINSEIAMYGKSDAARRIAAAGLKVEADSRKYLDGLKAAGVVLTDKELRQLNEVTDAARDAAEQREADLMAAQGAQQLYEQNEQFGINMMLSEQERANAIVQIERRKWLALIDAATKGSEARANLEKAFAQWDANQAAAPALNQQKRVQQEQIRSWGQVIDNVGTTFRTGFADMMNDGKAGWDSLTKSMETTFNTTVVDSLYTALAKPFTVSLLAEVAGITGGDKVKNGILEQNGMSSSALDGMSGIFSAGKSVYDMLAKPQWFTDFGGTLAGTLENWGWQNMGSDMFGDLSAAIINNSESIAQFANVAGDVLGYGTAVLNAFNGKFGSAVGGAIGTYFGGPIGSFIGSQIGAMVDGMLAGEKRFGGVWKLGEDGRSRYSHGPSGGSAGADAAMTRGMDNTVGAINTILRQMGSAASVVNFAGGLETSEKGRGGVIGVGQLSTGAAFGQGNLAGNNYKGTYYSSNFSTSPDLETALENYGTLMKQVTLQAIQVATDIPNAVRSIIAEVDTTKLTDEAATELLNTISNMTQQVRQFENAVERLPFANLRKLSFDAYHAIIAFSGGMENLTTNLNTYFENFYTQDEQMATAFSGLENTFKGLGLTVPFTKDSFMELVKSTGDAGGAATTAKNALRGLIEAQDNTTQSGQLVTATLLGISGSFAEWVNYMQGEGQKFLDNKATTDKEAEDAPKKALEDLNKEFDRMLGNVRDAAQRANNALSNLNAAGSLLDRLDLALNRPGGTAAAAREQQLWSALQTASLEQQVDLAGELTTIVLDRYQAEKQNLEQLVELGKSLQAYVQSLKLSDLSPMTLGQQLAEAGQQYQETLAKARGGDVEAMGQLQATSQTYLQLAQRYYASSEQYTAIFNSVTGALDTLGASSQTDALRQLEVGTESLAQLEQLRGIAGNAYTALDRQYQQAVTAAQQEMLGLERIATETGRLSDVTALLAGLPAELAAALQVMLPGTSVDNWYRDTLGRDSDSAGKGYWLDQINKNGMGAARDEFNNASKAEQWLAGLYQSALGRTLDAAGRDYWLQAMGQGFSRESIEDAIRSSPEATKLRGYADGGLAHVGLAVVGEAGPEIVDFSRPGRVYRNDELASAIYSGRGQGSSNADVVAELRAVRAELAQLRAERSRADGDQRQAVFVAADAGARAIVDGVGGALERRSYEASERGVKLE